MWRSLSIGVLPMRSRMLSTGGRAGRVKRRIVLELRVAGCELGGGTRNPQHATRNKNGGPKPAVESSMLFELRPAGRPARGPALVVAVAAVDRLAADGGERNFRRHT